MIESSPNLPINIRNNGGSTDEVCDQLLPYLCLRDRLGL